MTMSIVLHRTRCDGVAAGAIGAGVSGVTAAAIGAGVAAIGAGAVVGTAAVTGKVQRWISRVRGFRRAPG
jgi:hypothetical protein